MAARRYKNIKNLKKENLRDNMITTEIVLNMLVETATTEISKASNPTSFAENRQIAKSGSEVVAYEKNIWK